MFTTVPTLALAALALAPQGSSPAHDPARAAAWEATLRENEELFADRPELSVQEQAEIRARLAEAMAQATAIYVIDGSDDLLASGPGFGARFHRDGWEFVPSLPDTYAGVSFELVSVRRTGSERAVAGGVAPRRVGSGWDQLIEVDHGAGLVERFEIRAEGIEQSFEFAQPLTGTGDLVVRLRIDSALAAPIVHESREGLRFSLDAENAVRLGGVTGIGAQGERAEGWMSFDGVHLDLVLPESFVDSASYPLVLDPLVGSEISYSSSASTSSTSPDVAYDVTNDTYAIVQERQVLPDTFSSGWSQLSINLVSPDGTIAGGAGYGSSNSNYRNPCIANMNDQDAFIFVCEAGPNPDVGDPRGLLMFTFDAATNSGISSFASLDTPGDQRNPDICGDPLVDFNDALIVWHEVGAGVAGAVVDVPGAGGGAPTLVGSTFTIATDASDRAPAVCVGLGSPGRALVVWQRFDNGDQIYGRLYDYQGAALSSEVAITSAPGAENFSPKVDGDGDQFMVVYESGNGVLRDIKGVKATWDGAALNVGPESTVQAGGYLIIPGIGFSGEAYLVAWTNFSETKLEAKTVFPDCSTCEKTIVVSDVPGFATYQPEIATTYSSSLAGTQAMMTWQSQDLGLPDFNGTTKAHVFDVVASGAASEALRNSAIAPNPAAMVPDPAGPPVLGTVWNPSIDHTSFLPGSGLDGLIVRVSPLDLPLPPLGTLLVNIVAPGKTFFAGPGAPFGIPLPLDCSLIGVSLYAQGLSATATDTKLCDALDVVLGTF